MSKRCSANNRNGKRCGAWSAAGSDKCALYSDPELAAKMGSKHGRRASLPSQPTPALMMPPKTAGDVRDALANNMAQVYARQIAREPDPLGHHPKPGSRRDASVRAV
jgi:hypothetical protein